VFERARENRPSIVFIDEIDAIAGTRGEFQVHDSHVNQLLAEIDGVTGQRGVFVIGATNRPDQLDPALLRGGRLSRTIYLGLPDEAGRLAILRLHTARMPTVGVRFEELATETEGFSPADLNALSQEAALVAMERGQAQSVEAAVTPRPLRGGTDAAAPEPGDRRAGRRLARVIRPFEVADFARYDQASAPLNAGWSARAFVDYAAFSSPFSSMSRSRSLACSATEPAAASPDSGLSGVSLRSGFGDRSPMFLRCS
jgi:SpoVK/Ycf46/Vps4 family AAA+-type ATPase